MNIRKASIIDSESVIQMVYTSGPEMYDYLFKTKRNSAIDYMRYEFNTGNGLCGFKNITIGIKENKPVVTGSFFDKKQYNKIALGTIKNLISYYGLMRVIPVVFRILNIERISKEPRKGEIYLANFCVDDNHRGQGIGTFFITENMKKYKEEGYEIFGLDVLINNTRAEKLYSKLGLCVTSIKPFKTKRYGLNIPGSKKMELLL